jgi:hypothetical protein
MAGGRNDILAAAAGVTAGAWYAAPAARVDTELLVGGMLITAGGYDGKPLDYTELERWRRIGFERGMRSARASGDQRVRQCACSQGMGEPRREIPGAPFCVRLHAYRASWLTASSPS